MVTFSDHFRLALQILEYVFTAFFTFEYLVRIYCSPKPKKYIFSFFGIVDLLATLPLYLGFLFTSARYLLIIRTFRLIRVFRVFKLFNFLEEGNLLLVSLRLSSRKIFVFFFFVLILVTSIGTIMFMVEGTQPDTQFNNIPNCIYWAIVTMTTVGYGDITPVTPVGRFISALCDADRLYDHCCTYGYRFCHDDQGTPEAERIEMPPIVSALDTRKKLNTVNTVVES